MHADRIVSNFGHHLTGLKVVSLIVRVSKSSLRRKGHCEVISMPVDLSAHTVVDVSGSGLAADLSLSLEAITKLPVLTAQDPSFAVVEVCSSRRSTQGTPTLSLQILPFPFDARRQGALAGHSVRCLQTDTWQAAPQNPVAITDCCLW